MSRAFRRGYYRNQTKLRACVAGSGTLLNEPTMGPQVIKLTGKSDPRDVTVVYLGTASYDIIEKRDNQTSWYSEQGCTVIALDVVLNAPETSYMKECMQKADIILVSGGNTNFAMRRWRHIGLDKLLKEACLGPHRAVMAGGSAGAICWFSGGHSDSLDPDSFEEAKLHLHGDSHHSSDIDDETDLHALASEHYEDNTVHNWDYMRADGLGFIPGLCCPHHDRVQSNGVLRAIDFDKMLLRHPTEVGLCIDHNAAFLIEGNHFRVIYPEGFVGSVLPDKTFSEERIGRPGVWLKEVLNDGTVSARLCPEEGRLSDLLKLPVYIEQSTRHLNYAAEVNPDDGPLRMSYPGFQAKSFYGGKVTEELTAFFAEHKEEEEEKEEHE